METENFPKRISRRLKAHDARHMSRTKEIQISICCFYTKICTLPGCQPNIDNVGFQSSFIRLYVIKSKQQSMVSFKSGFTCHCSRHVSIFSPTLPPSSCPSSRGGDEAWTWAPLFASASPVWPRTSWTPAGEASWAAAEVAGVVVRVSANLELVITNC